MAIISEQPPSASAILQALRPVELVGDGIAVALPHFGKAFPYREIPPRVLERRCQRAIFFEDPHVARQHEADIQLLERTVTTVSLQAAESTVERGLPRWGVVEAA